MSNAAIVLSVAAELTKAALEYQQIVLLAQKEGREVSDEEAAKAIADARATVARLAATP
jgi:F0F1-type ATP synthase membrane subunit b/b'